jgi:serine protease Do
MKKLPTLPSAFRPTLAASLIACLFSLLYPPIVPAQDRPSGPAQGAAHPDEAPPAPPATASSPGETPPVNTPISVLDRQIQDLVAQVTPATVGLLAPGGGASGSGVIVSSDGLILSAAHVSLVGREGDFLVLFPDGRQATAKPLGAQTGRDASMLQIVEDGPWPFVEIAEDDPTGGDWVVAMGHPGGFDLHRTPPVRIGRVLSSPAEGLPFVTTDCTVSGGDSGGPLFDLEGRVVGIHSNIGMMLSQNRHVPISVYHQHWERMKKGDRWGGRLASGPTDERFLDPGQRPRLGVVFDARQVGAGAVVEEVLADSPAARAGIKPGDRITSFAGSKVTDGPSLVELVQAADSGVPISVEIQREGQTETIELTLGNELAGAQPDEAAPGAPEGDSPSPEELSQFLDLLGEKDNQRGKSLLPFDLSRLAELMKGFAKAPPTDGDFSASSPSLGARIEQIESPEGSLVRVSEVREGSPAEAAGLKPGDLILGIDGEKATDIDWVADAIQAVGQGNPFELQIQRGDGQLALEATLPRPAENPGNSSMEEALGQMLRGFFDQHPVPENPQLQARPSPGSSKIRPERRRDSRMTLDALSEPARQTAPHTVTMVDGDTRLCLGTVVAENLILTKHSEIERAENLRVRLPGGTTINAEVVDSRRNDDLALVRVEGANLSPATWNTELPIPGKVVTAPSPSGAPLSIGVVSVAPRDLSGTSQGFLGIQMAPVPEGQDPQAGVLVTSVINGTAAQRGDIKQGDVIVSINGESVGDPVEMRLKIAAIEPGSMVNLEVVREGRYIGKSVMLGDRAKLAESAQRMMDATAQMGTPMSKQKTGFPSVIEHDVVLAPDQCGGPLVDISGRILGINIARAGRTKSYAIPAGRIAELLAPLSDGNASFATDE